MFTTRVLLSFGILSQFSNRVNLHFCVIQTFVDEHAENSDDDGCQAHWCMNGLLPVTCSLSTHQPVLDGTWCDVNKWCIEGHCIANKTITASSNTPRCNCNYQTFPRYLRIYLVMSIIVSALTVLMFLWLFYLTSRVIGLSYHTRFFFPNFRQIIL